MHLNHVQQDNMSTFFPYFFFFSIIIGIEYSLNVYFGLLVFFEITIIYCSFHYENVKAWGIDNFFEQAKLIIVCCKAVIMARPGILEPFHLMIRMNWVIRRRQAFSYYYSIYETNQALFNISLESVLETCCLLLVKKLCNGDNYHI